MFNLVDEEHDGVLDSQQLQACPPFPSPSFLAARPLFAARPPSTRSRAPFFVPQVVLHLLGLNNKPKMVIAEFGNQQDSTMALVARCTPPLLPLSLGDSLLPRSSPRCALPLRRPTR